MARFSSASDPASAGAPGGGPVGAAGRGANDGGVLSITKTFSALRIPAYRLLWVSSLFSTTGMQLQMFARGLLAYQLGGTAGAIGIVSLASAIPQLAFSMVGGTVADRFERRKLMILSQALTAVIAIVVSVMVYTHVMTITYLFMVGLIQGTIMSFSMPARTSFIPEVVGEKELMNAMALNNAGMNVSRIGTPSLAAALVAVSWIDLGGLYTIQSLLNVASLTLLFFLPAIVKGGVKAVDRERLAGGIVAPAAPRRRRGSMAKDLGDGFRYVARSPILLTLLGIGLIPTLLGQSYQQFFPVFAKNVFGDGVHRNAGALGFMGTMSGIGALAGSLTVASLAEYRRRTQIQLAAGVGFGLFLACFAVQSSFGAAVIALVGVGFMSSFLQSLNSTMLVSASDPEYYGRVMSLNMLTFSLMPIGTFIMGFVIDAIGHLHSGPLNLLGVQAAYVGAGVLIVAFMLAVTVFNASYRKLEQDDLKNYARVAGNRMRAGGAAEPAAEPAGGS